MIPGNITIASIKGNKPFILCRLIYLFFRLLVDELEELLLLPTDVDLGTDLWVELDLDGATRDLLEELLRGVKLDLLFELLFDGLYEEFDLGLLKLLFDLVFEGDEYLDLVV